MNILKHAQHVKESIMSGKKKEEVTFIPNFLPPVMPSQISEGQLSRQA